MAYKVCFPDFTSTLQVIGFHFRVAEPGWTYPDHYHKMFEILYCYDGSAVQYIEDRSIAFGRGDWLVIPPGMRHHAVNSGPSNYIYLSIHFDIDDLDFRQWLQTQNVKKWNNSQLPRVGLTRQIEDLDELIMNKILAMTSSTGFPREVESTILVKERFRLQAIILTVLSEIIEVQLHNSEPRQITRQENSLYEVETAHRIERYISENLHIPNISINMIAKQLCISRVQCHKLFTKVYKISPRQYMTNKKLQHAKYLLLHTDLKIQMISELLGFSSQSHFSRQFKRWTGISPLRYRPKSYSVNHLEPKSWVETAKP
ncbi:AraC family transcriptional regulator [Paenibacillus alkalitolerans]|uniref:AraC family transcriptional regulator n=1 Tax=Paenibacillus alkalitolerans TaxID=2799335 RepID=UPI0018F48113|nr:helix-turn-helix domain-containing protein [Paenibacillus alkalitolerans]